ncbi:MAG: 3',5'-cyclic adenosine monophosphate phosphodiesterase CpdA [Gemmatimonadaceae bacterium]|nr:3',5'-cyclic adenosine monophosphate phosphodiesterase CpdA [Gemmatimonadaceae bacterium]
MPEYVRILFLADTHLGFDLPMRPRIDRRRRGRDFLANYATALAPALAGEVDVVVHGGDVFDRSHVAPVIAYRALEPLRAVADRGVPVFIVPGNHERSRLPHPHFAAHPGVHLFDRPRTFTVEVGGLTLAISGFPYERRGVRQRFVALLQETEWPSRPADLRLLCMHQCVEGAAVGPSNYTFTTAEDVVRASDLPAGFAAVLSGHIHRHQVLTRDLRGAPLAAPVLYPGSIERTALAELGEPKGFLLLRLESRADGSRCSVDWEFRALPARPMIRERVVAGGGDPRLLDEAIRGIVAAAPPDAVLSIGVSGTIGAAEWRVMSASHIRGYAPPTLNVEIRILDRAMVRRHRARESASPPDAQLSMW